MTLLTRELFRHLAQQEGQMLISLLMPLHTGGPDREKNRIILKDLVFEAEKQLRDRDLRNPEIDRRLEPLRRMIDDARMWPACCDGLAIFLDDDNNLQIFGVPLKLDPRATVSTRYNLEPLVELLSEDGRIYILALSQPGVRLIEVSQSGYRLLEWEDLPARLSQVMQTEAGPRPLHFHSAGPPTGEAPTSIFHSATEDMSQVVQSKLRAAMARIDEALDPHLRPERAPLVLAGTPKLVGLYREASKYPYLLAEYINGSPEHINPADLAEKARALVRPHAEQRRRQVLEAYGTAAAHDRGSHDVGEIVLASFAARVETLLTDLVSDIWGKVDPTRPAVDIHTRREPDDDELTNLAAVQTLRHDGRVFIIPQPQMPEQSPLAAIYRY